MTKDKVAGKVKVVAERVARLKLAQVVNVSARNAVTKQNMRLATPAISKSVPSVAR